MLEHEHKYEVRREFTVPDLAGAKGIAHVGKAIEQTLVATYFDTPDHRLAAVDVSIRRRTGGDDDGWHLKVPSAVEPSARHELRIGLGRAVRTVPKQLRSIVAGLTGAQAMSPVATVTTRRTVRRLSDEDGSVLAEVADDSVEAELLTGPDPEPDSEDAPAPMAWREIEVELVDGDPTVLSSVGKRLVKAGAQRSLRRSKLTDLLGGPVAQQDSPSRPKDSVQLLVQHQLTTQLEVLHRTDPAVRQNLPEAVHMMRVAVRRLRAALTTNRPFLDRTMTDPLREELGWLSDALGAARDAEVQRARLDAAVDALVEEHPDIDWNQARARRGLRSSLLERHTSALTDLDAVMSSDRYAALLDRLREFVADPPWTEKAHKRIRGAYGVRAEREMRRLGRRMHAADDPALSHEERAEALHDARKAAKRVRYAVEPLIPVYGEPAAALRTRLKALQSALGHHQDTVVTRTYLLDLSRSASPLDPVAALLAGALVERETREAAGYEQRAAKAWHRVTLASMPE